MADKKKIVARDFFCIKERIAYKKGDEYKGSRTDINHLMEVDEVVKEKKAKK